MPMLCPGGRTRPNQIPVEERWRAEVDRLTSGHLQPEDMRNQKKTQKQKTLTGKESKNQKPAGSFCKVGLSGLEPVTIFPTANSQALAILCYTDVADV